MKLQRKENLAEQTGRGEKSQAYLLSTPKLPGIAIQHILYLVLV